MIRNYFGNPFRIYEAYNNGYNQALEDIKDTLNLTPEQVELVESLEKGE